MIQIQRRNQGGGASRDFYPPKIVPYSAVACMRKQLLTLETDGEYVANMDICYNVSQGDFLRMLKQKFPPL